MSRNKEKSQSVLHRLEALKNEEAGVLQSNPNLRPKNVQSVTSLPQAEKWRSTLISEISIKLTSINNPELNDYQIRDTNDEINKKYKEKRAWEHHIKYLGGPDYINYNQGNNEMPGIFLNGYRYFGRAKELPDVKEILEIQKNQRQAKLTKHTKELEEKRILKERESRIDPGYYGLYDENGIEGVIDTDLSMVINDINTAVRKEVLETVDLLNELYNDTKDQPLENDILKFEQKIRRQILRTRTGQKQKGSDKSDTVSSIRSVPSKESISNWLVKRRRKELKAKLGIK